MFFSGEVQANPVLRALLDAHYVRGTASDYFGEWVRLGGCLTVRRSPHPRDLLPVVAQLGIGGRKYMPVFSESAANAARLERVGPQVLKAIKAELRKRLVAGRAAPGRGALRRWSHGGALARSAPATAL